MPELPEVETITRDLNQIISGKKITKVTIPDEFDLKDISSKEFIDRATSKVVFKAKRIGKMISLQLNNGDVILFHLKMTGLFSFFSKESEIPKHVKIIFEFDDGTKLNFSDVRKFGVVRLVNKKELNTIKYIKTLGIDPTTEEYTLDNFFKLIKKHPNKTVKSFLMDQHLICGIGNIYASEIMYKSKINPTIMVIKLTVEQNNKLFKTIKEILLKAIENRGTTFSDYRDTIGHKGTNQENLKVYNRKDEKCFSCNQNIIKIVQNSRSTFYCPKCQT